MVLGINKKPKEAPVQNAQEQEEEVEEVPETEEQEEETVEPEDEELTHEQQLIVNHEKRIQALEAAFFRLKNIV